MRSTTRRRAGSATASDDRRQASGFRVLFEWKPLLVLAAASRCFHLGNGAMLPLYGLAVVGGKGGRSRGLRRHHHRGRAGGDDRRLHLRHAVAEKRGYWLVLLISFIALPIRGLVAAT